MPESHADVPPEPEAATSGTSAPPASEPMSAIEHVRRTPMAPAAVALGVGVIAGLVLSFLVPDDPGAFAMLVLGAAVTAAVGFTVRFLVRDVRPFTLGVAAVSAGLGVHVMGVTGSLQGSLPLLDQVGVGGPGFNDALLAALAVPPFSAGALMAAAVAAIIAGWGRARS